MEKETRKEYLESFLEWLDIFIVMVLATLIIIVLMNMRSIQKNARVINYAGIVRGGTQRLVKQELQGHENDALIAQLDEILLGLQNGSADYNISKLNSAAYNAKLASLAAAWENLKTEILAARTNAALKARLYDLSEDYFTLADETVSAAETYTEESNRSIQADTVFIIILVSYTLVRSLIKAQKLARANALLNTAAFVDAATGLSNKGKCEERLSNPDPIPENVTIACYMFDLNGLKKTNDLYGHEAGDRLIAGFGTAFRNAALPHMFTGRSGGDEFMAIAVNPRPAEIHGFLETLKTETINAKLDYTSDPISYASGCAVSTEHPGLTIRALMKIADQRMYEDKAAGKMRREDLA